MTSIFSKCELNKVVISKYFDHKKDTLGMLQQWNERSFSLLPFFFGSINERKNLCYPIDRKKCVLESWFLNQAKKKKKIGNNENNLSLDGSQTSTTITISLSVESAAIATFRGTLSSISTKSWKVMLGALKLKCAGTRSHFGQTSLSGSGRLQFWALWKGNLAFQKQFTIFSFEF